MLEGLVVPFARVASRMKFGIVDRVPPLRGSPYQHSTVAGRVMVGSGTLAAHKDIRLVLLHSWPDTIRGALLRKTQTATHNLPATHL